MTGPRKPNHCTNCGVIVKYYNTMCRECDYAYLDQIEAVKGGYNGPLKPKDFKVFTLPEGWKL